jgi:hypothetical protein
MPVGESPTHHHEAVQVEALAVHAPLHAPLDDRGALPGTQHQHADLLLRQELELEIDVADQADDGDAQGDRKQGGFHPDAVAIYSQGHDRQHKAAHRDGDDDAAKDRAVGLPQLGVVQAQRKRKQQRGEREENRVDHQGVRGGNRHVGPPEQPLQLHGEQEGSREHEEFDDHQDFHPGRVVAESVVGHGALGIETLRRSLYER